MSNNKLIKIKRKLPAIEPPPVIVEYNKPAAIVVAVNNNNPNPATNVLPIYQEYLDRFKADAT